MPILPAQDAPYDGLSAAPADLAAALDRIDTGILVLGADMRARLMNRRFKELFAIPPAMAASSPAYEDLLAHCATSIWSFIPIEDRADYLRRRAAGVRCGSVPPTQVDLGDGRQFRFTCDVTDGGGRILTYLDISAILRQGAEEAADRASAELRFHSETMQSQAEALAALAEEAETARQRLEQEIEERRLLEDQLRLMATTDGLTGVLNRSAFMAAGERELALSRRSGQDLAVLMLDADHFKSVNDRYGHAGGDLTLRHLANSCKKSVRSTDWVGRLGGEEFALILPGASRARAAAVAEGLRGSVAAARLAHGDLLIQVTVSIGVAMARPGDSSIEQVIARADAALYRAKDGGRNRVTFEPAA